MPFHLPNDLYSPAKPAAPRSILLVEGYDPLAAAIVCALKKFAPHHAARTAPSFAAAANLAEAIHPELFIIDFDPPPAGATGFLGEMRKALPDARAIVIGPGISQELATKIRPFVVTHFIQKPFDLVDFGAAVQALLGPGQAPAATQERAALHSLGLADLVLVQCAGRRSIILQVTNAAGSVGEVHICDGQVTHAATGNRRDRAALAEMFGWIAPQVEEIAHRSIPCRTIRSFWTQVFFDALQEAHPLPVAKTPPRVPAPTSKPLARTGKKLVVIDDTEMLLVFVEDTLLLADPQLQITTAPNGITGLKQVESVRPDLVLLDYSLPDINGDEVCRRLLENEKTADIPVLMMSGHVTEMAATAECCDNVVAVIAKPFMSESLVALVQETLAAPPRALSKRRERTPTLAAPSSSNTHAAETHDEIASRARQLWEEAGRPEGHSDKFWFAAESELRLKSVR